MALQIKKASRELVFTKLALMGASGSGKTYSALRLAKGMATALKPILGRDAKTIMFNTESTRGLYYANEFEYDIVNIDAPHHPEKYVEAINDVVKLGYDILIIDSTSHEWMGSGGCLELQQLAGGTYQAWAKVTPRHNDFIEAIADSPIHLIATMRGKEQYEVEKGETGKTTVRKLGVGAEQRSGFSFEFTATFLLDQQDNHATVEKDNTHIFENKGRFIFKEEDGEDIIAWANSGSGYTPVVRNKPVVEPVGALTEAKNMIISLAKDLSKTKGDAMKAVFAEFKIDATPKAIKNISDEKVTKELMQKLEELKGE